MGWIKKVAPPPPPHICDIHGLSLDGVDIGSIYKCDECGKCWELLDIAVLNKFAKTATDKYRETSTTFNGCDMCKWGLL